jgi:hypothetical protein
MFLDYDLGKAKFKTLRYFLCGFAPLREKKKKHKEKIFLCARCVAA